MEILLSIGLFIKVFAIFFAILYCLRAGYEVAKVWTLKEGKVELGKHGLFFLGGSIAYLLACIFA